jgi:hypothetical protein
MADRARVNWAGVGALMGALSVVLALAGGAWAYWTWPRCERWEEVLATDAQNRSIRDTLEACGDLGTVLKQTVELVTSGKRFLVAEIIPTGGASCGSTSRSAASPLRAQWIGANAIRLSAGSIADFGERKDLVAGVRIEYGMKEIMALDCPATRSGGGR